MKAKEYKAKKVATTDHAIRTYIYGWDDALQMVDNFLSKVLKRPDLGMLIKGIGQADVDEITGTPYEEKK